ncbi:Protein CBG18177 [Caenorhabditis briggsae]|uniref:Protein CBG18177 n=1 Tax=Caenorhabditis briggsae TaxID=6238 RepID=A8XT69_CAEBR|nr:Protein CBG18177 [Caenorhabditis briggsae]CAP35672.1 Protein CBG18177 [Caenorhabditis briggsae]
MTTLKDQAKLRNETDAFFNALFIQAILVSLWTSVLEVVLLYGVIKNRSKLLRVSMYISLIHLTFDFGGILFTPVYFASQVSSGYKSNDTYPNILGVKTAEEDRFVMGLVTGYSVEIISTASVARGFNQKEKTTEQLLFTVSVLQFVLINRCYVYAKSIEKGFLAQSKLSVLRF